MLLAKNEKMKYKKWASLLKQIVVANIESAGLIFEKITPLRATIMVSAVVATFLFWYYKSTITLQFAIYYAAFHFIFRQSFLMLSFTKTGIAYQLKKHFGVAKGAQVYEFITGMSFFHRSYSFILLVECTTWLGLGFLKDYEIYLKIVAYIFSAIGLIVNTWAFILIKRETYYYLDMYYGRFLVPFSKTGPFKWFKNPMYSVGQLPSLGAALAAGSLVGTILTLLNVVSCYLFYYLFERPHIKKVLAKMKIKEKM